MKLNVPKTLVNQNLQASGALPLYVFQGSFKLTLLQVGHTINVTPDGRKLRRLGR